MTILFHNSDALNLSYMKKSLKYLSLFLFSVFVLNSYGVLAQFSEVKTDKGMISGYRNGDISIFKGIPFAAPPVGDLRWREPQPAQKWSGVLKCEKFSASPMQSKPVPFMMWTEEFITPPENLSEDCLYLNVWTPAKKASDKLPVLVWIYGGGFSSGSAACAVYDGEEMSKKGIIFVSINYRVGALGFLTHPELSSETKNKVSGNYGLMDQVAALKWIQKNISEFGGDPQKVTIAGQSAGSMSVGALVVSPLAKGLFRGAIAQSGGILSSFLTGNLAESEKSGVAYMNNLKAKSIAELRKMPAADLIAAGGNFRPVADGYVIPLDIMSAFKKGNFNDVTMMSGWVTGDGSLMGNQASTPEKYKEQSSKDYGAKAEEFIKLFPGNTSEEVASSMKEMGLMQFAAFPAHLWAVFSKRSAYIYQFGHVPVDKPGFPNYGAFHTSEVPFALHTLHMWKRPWRESDISVERTMSNYWANFVKNGNPNGKGLPEWSVYTKATGDIMEIGDIAKLTPALHKSEFDFLEGIAKK